MRILATVELSALIDALQKRYGFEFMEPLVSDMVQTDPSKRPKIEEVVRRFNAIRGSLSWWKLRSRISGRKEIIPVRLWRSCVNLYRTAVYLTTGRPAIPDV